MYSFWALFVLYEVQLDNKTCYDLQIAYPVRDQFLCRVADGHVRPAVLSSAMKCSLKMVVLNKE